MDTETKENPGRAEFGEPERRLATAERERDQWKARFEDVVTSRSWRLTEPLRAFKRRFQR